MDRKIVFVCCLVMSLLIQSLSAQMLLRSVDTLEFAHFEADTLAFDMRTSKLVPFFQKFDEVVTTDEGNVNILHLGSSHVQAGTLSHTIRRNLLLSYPHLIARRGMIFPYSAANKCNNPADYLVKRSCEFQLIRNVYQEHLTPLGATGIAVYVQGQPAEIKITLNDADLEFCTNRIIVLGESNDGKVVPWIRIDTTYYYPVIKDLELRRYVFEVKDFTDSFTVVMPCDSTQRFTLTGVFLDNDRPGLTFHSIGVNGADLDDYLRCPYLATDMELLQPDMVIFGIGINDANSDIFDSVTFKNRYLQLIQRIRQVNPDCAFVFITNNDSYKKISRRNYAVNRNNLQVRDVMYRLAEETQGAVWDQFDIMGGLKSMDKWRQSGYAQTDRIHFTVKGYKLLGDLFFNAFMEAYSECGSHSSSLP
ncbi:MAG: hypothetical protein J5644_10395 [Bacteroidales bacterium]|nr:hypothetical protein [Bacteroidales bacterium]